MIKKYKRIIIALGLSFMLFLIGLLLMEHNAELSGALFLFSAIGAILYLPFYKFLTRKKTKEAIRVGQQKEVGIAASLLAVLFGIGAIETYKNQFLISVIFLEILLFLLIFIYVNFLKNRSNSSFTAITNDVPLRNVVNSPFENKSKKYIFPEWLFGLFFIGNGLLIVTFEDTFGNEDEFVFATLAYFLLAIIVIPRWIFQKIKSIIQLRKEQKQTELLHLQSQVNPHFFFNVLNNLYGWVGKDTKVAQSLILQLSDMMRYSIYDGQKETVSLEEEIDYLNNYIALHKMRYHKKIEVSFKVDIQEAAYQVRPLLFIILLENAFKHGVENLRENAFVDLELLAQNQHIYFSIENNFDSENKALSAGIGLKNLKRRLELVYPKKHTLSLEVKENMYKATLNIQLT